MGTHRRRRNPGRYGGPLGFLGGLPNEILRHLVSFLTIKDKGRLLSTCKTFHITKRPLFLPFHVPGLNTTHETLLSISELRRAARVHDPLKKDYLCYKVPRQGRVVKRCFLSQTGHLCLMVFEGGFSLYNFAWHRRSILDSCKTPAMAHFSPDSTTLVLVGFLVVYLVRIDPKDKSASMHPISLGSWNSCLASDKPFLNSAYTRPKVLVMPCNNSVCRLRFIVWPNVVCEHESYQELSKHNFASCFFNLKGGHLGWMEDDGRSVRFYEGEDSILAWQGVKEVTPLACVDLTLLILKEARQSESRLLVVNVLLGLLVYTVDLKMQVHHFVSPCFALGEDASGKRIIGSDIFSKNHYLKSKDHCKAARYAISQLGQMRWNTMDCMTYHRFWFQPGCRPPPVLNDPATCL